MDKIRTVKIKNSDGTISENTYYLSVAAKDVDMANGKELQETIGTINIDTDGNIAEQLENLNNDINNINNNIDDLNIDIKKKAYFFNTVVDMKNADLKIGDYVCTLGYYEVNDEGNATYEIVNDNTLIDDGGSIHELNNGLRAKLIANVYVNVDQFGAKGDGENDDYDAILNCMNYARENKLKVEFSSKNYLIGSTINLDISQDEFVGNNTKITGNTSLEKLFTFNNSVYPPFYNVKTIIKNIEFTSKGNKSATCFYFSSAKDVSHIQIENCNFYNFENAIYIYTNTYKVNFINCDIHGNTNCVIMPNGGTNYGENISFISCCIYNSDNAVINENENGCIFLNGSSIDYNKFATKTTGNAIIKASECHIEGRQKFYGNLTCNNSILLFLTLDYENDDNILFNFYDTLSNNNIPIIQFNNCYIIGNTQTNINVTNNNNGIVDFNNCKTINDNQFLTYLYNNRSCVFKGIPLYDTRDATVTIQDEKIIFQKTVGIGGNGDLYLFIPLKPSFSRMRISMNVKVTASGKAYLTTKKGILIDYTRRSLENSVDIGDKQVDSTLYGDNELLLIMDFNVQTTFRNCAFLRFNCNSLSNDGVIEISNIRAWEI